MAKYEGSCLDAVQAQSLAEKITQHEVQMRELLVKLHFEHEQRIESKVNEAVHRALRSTLAREPNSQSFQHPPRFPETSDSGNLLKQLPGTVCPAEEIIRGISGDTHSSRLPSNQNSGISALLESPSMRKLQKKKTKSLEETTKEVQKKVKSAGSILKMARETSPTRGRIDLSERTLESFVVRFVGSSTFDYIVGACILVNVIFIGVQTDLAVLAIQNPEEKVPDWFRYVDIFFTVFFAVEVLLRAYVLRSRFFLGKDKGWNIFDTIIVTSAILEEVLQIGTSTTVIRILRILRLVRIIRFIKVMRIFSDLRAMVRGIINSVLSLVWAIILLLMIMFTAAVFITQVLTSHLQEQSPPMSAEQQDDALKHFGSLMTTIYSLYKAISGGGDWGEYSDSLFMISPIMGVFFCLYIAFTVFAVLNVVTGVFVDGAITSAQRDAESEIMSQTAERTRHIEDVRSIFKRADVDQTGSLDWTEFEQHFGDACVQAYFRRLQLDIDGEEALRDLWSMLDFDGDGSVDMNEFLDGCSRLKGNASSLDLARLTHNQARMEKRLVGICKEHVLAQQNQGEALALLSQKVDFLMMQLQGSAPPIGKVPPESPDQKSFVQLPPVPDDGVNVDVSHDSFETINGNLKRNFRPRRLEDVEQSADSEDP